MKKTLFSIAFLAASGAYVAAANHVFDPASPPATAEALPAMPGLDEEPAATLAPAGAAPAPVPLVTHRPPAPSEVPQTLAETAPPVIPPVDAAPLPQALVAAPAPVTPPLPRPRPTPPATPAVQPAASTDTASASTGGVRDGTYTGSSENAYYGRVQVQITVTGHQVASVKVLDYPQDRRTSRYINSQALPILKQEAIGTTTANIDAVSGATLTSRAYIRSLGTALRQAGGGNA